MGGMGTKETREILKRISATPTDKQLTLVATGKYIGEGFDEPRLDTLFLAMPISWKGTLQQYAGRLHRLFENKSEVQVYDYVDIHVRMLEKMYNKRLNGYAAIGYKAKGESIVSESIDIIFDKSNFLDTLKTQPFGQIYESPIFIATLLCSDSPYITNDAEIEFTLKIENKFLTQHFLNLRWWLPEGFVVTPTPKTSISLENYHGNVRKVQCVFTVKVPQFLLEPKYDLVLEISANARHTKLYIPVTLLNMQRPKND
jgi:hypothetical protein